MYYKPDYADAHYNLGIVLWKQGRLDHALKSYQHALRHKPDHVDTHLNLGNVLKDQGRLDEAIAAYRAAFRLKPDAAHIHSNINFILHYHPGYDARAIREECRRWNDRHAQPLEKVIRPHTNLARSRSAIARRLRLAGFS